MDKVIFYRARAAKNGYLSPYSYHGYFRRGFWFPTVEHDYQSAKLAHCPLEHYVREAKTPQQARQVLARSSGPFAGWEDIKEDVMRACLKAKFTEPANIDILNKLLATGDAEIVESSEYEYYWGIADGSGKNRLGILLMELRSELRTDRS